jgi:hypothetical protein
MFEPIASLRRKPSPQKLRPGAVIYRFGQVLDALLVAPRVVDYQPALRLAEAMPVPPVP